MRNESSRLYLSFPGSNDSEGGVPTGVESRGQIGTTFLREDHGTKTTEIEAARRGADSELRRETCPKEQAEAEPQAPRQSELLCSPPSSYTECGPYQVT